MCLAIRFPVIGKSANSLCEKAQHAELPPPSERAWNEKAVNTLRKMSTSCRESLMSGALVPYLVDWASTPKNPEAGVGFADVCYAFDKDTGVVT